MTYSALSVKVAVMSFDTDMVRTKHHFFVKPKPNGEGLMMYDTVAVRTDSGGKLFEIKSFTDTPNGTMVNMTSGDSFSSTECWRLWL